MIARYARIFFRQYLLGLKLTSRTPASVFWVFAFPVAMLLGLGLVNSDNGPSKLKLVWSVDTPASDADQKFLASLEQRGLEVEQLAPTDAEHRWAEGKLPVLLEGGADHYSLRLNSYLIAQGGQIQALAQLAFVSFEARAQGASDLPSLPVRMQSPGGHHDGPYAAFLLPGMIGLNLLTMGIFSTGMVDVTMRIRGGYKRLATTPLPRALFLAAQLGVRLSLNISAMLLLILIGALVFGIHNQGSPATLLLLVLLGQSCFVLMGYVLSSFAGSIEAYNGIANLVFMPTMLLSGVYFSLDRAPQWLQQGVALFPMAALLRALRAVFNDGASLLSQSGNLAIVAAWTFGLFLLASRRFKWV